MADLAATGGVRSAVSVSLSPDGKRLIGLHRSKEDKDLAIYTIETQRLQVLRHADGGTFKIDDTGASWFRDNRRVIFWDLHRGKAFVADTVTGDVREIPDVPGPSELQLTDGDRTLIATRTVSESSIWLLTLGE